MVHQTFPFGEDDRARARSDEVGTSPTTAWSPLPKGEGLAAGVNPRPTIINSKKGGLGKDAKGNTN